jgi:integrase
MKTVRKVGIYEPERIPTADPKVSHYKVRWMIYFTDGTRKSCQRTITGKQRKEDFLGNLSKAEHGAEDKRTGLSWGWSDRYEPVLIRPDEVQVQTVWEMVRLWRTRTYSKVAPGTRKVEADALRRILRWFLRDPAGGMPEIAQAYLATVALRRRTEPKDMAALRAEHQEGTIWHQTPKVRRPVSAEQLWEGRKWLDDNSAPLTAVTKDALIDLRDAHYPQGSNTASRGWSIWRGVLKFAAGEGMISRELYVFVGEEQPHVDVRPPVADEQIPTVAEMWHFSDVLGARKRRPGRGGTAGTYDRFRALPLVLGGAGLRIGEALSLRRKHIIDDAGGGIWIKVERSVSHPTKSYTNNQQGGADIRGTKGRRGGDMTGRRSFLPPGEAKILRQHLDSYVGPGHEDLLWPDLHGRPLRLSNLAAQIWDPAAKEAFPAGHRLHNLKRHAFRHLMATRCLRAGLPIGLVAKWGGWKRKSTLLDVYDAFLPGTDNYGAELLVAREAGKPAPQMPEVESLPQKVAAQANDDESEAPDAA